MEATQNAAATTGTILGDLGREAAVEMYVQTQEKFLLRQRH